MRGLRFKDWALIALVLLIFYLAAGCTTTRELPPLVAAPTPEQLQAQAQLPPYLVPPPPAASPKQVQRWTDAQTQALANVNAPAGKVKLKNVGNPKTTNTIHEGITGRQLIIGMVLLGALGLVCWLKPWLIQTR
ncbi:hypothetical protein [Hymenobacter rigui]|uniref:Uncharacterized protein n=1 Tax=Hymenobacter rigui TaxID=334424 RepID=A0A3R9PSY2_9BACT|nr:hypothetical protein [Hymenobacter rigui]RSK45176.1 hypothetical protein EI291_18875 [Hymenobacter rigui]